MTATVVASVLATLSACFGIAGGVALYLARKTPKQEAVQDPTSGPDVAYLEVIAARVAELEVIVRGLPSLWEEERERAKKHADRAAQAYRSAEQVLTAITGGDEDEEEGEGVREEHGEQLGLMSPVLADVAGSGARADAETALRERARRHLAAMG